MIAPWDLLCRCGSRDSLKNENKLDSSQESDSLEQVTPSNIDSRGRGTPKTSVPCREMNYCALQVTQLYYASVYVSVRRDGEGVKMVAGLMHIVRQAPQFVLQRREECIFRDGVQSPTSGEHATPFSHQRMTRLRDSRALKKKTQRWRKRRNETKEENAHTMTTHVKKSEWSDFFFINMTKSLSGAKKERTLDNSFKVCLERRKNEQQSQLETWRTLRCGWSSDPAWRSADRQTLVLEQSWQKEEKNASCDSNWAYKFMLCIIPYVASSDSLPRTSAKLFWMISTLLNVHYSVSVARNRLV